MEKKKRAVEETDLGMYVWLMPNGQLIGDGDGNYLNIPAKKGDKKRLARLTQVAHEVLRGNGIAEEGVPYFLPGRHRVTDEEYADQEMRLKSGLVPDEYDVAAMKESLAAERKFS